MKKIFCLLLALSLLLLPAACGAEEYQPQQDEPEAGYAYDEYPNQAEPLPENASNDDVNQEPPVGTSDEDITPAGAAGIIGLHSTSNWAKTPEYFFFSHTHRTSDYVADGEWVHHVEYMLYRLLLSNIAQGERVALPGDGEIEIVGISPQYLFVSRRTGDWWTGNFSTYRISLEDLQATLIDYGIYYGVPRFHPASNSILFAHGDIFAPEESCQRQINIRLESLQLDTGMRRIFYEYDSYNSDSGMGWRQLDSGDIVFINGSWGGVEWGSDFILIDAELNAARTQHDDIAEYLFPQPPPRSPAEEILVEQGLWYGHYATLEDWVYYLRFGWEDNVGWHGNLYRMGFYGTSNMLVQENTDIASLLNVNNTLLATVLVRPEDDWLGDDVDWHEAVVLSQDYGVAKILGGGWSGHNSGFGMQRLGDTGMVMIMDLNFFTVDGWVQGLYCTVTGALFSLTTP